MGLSPLTVLVRWLARFVLEHKREDIGLEIGEHVHALHTHQDRLLPMRFQIGRMYGLCCSMRPPTLTASQRC